MLRFSDSKLGGISTAYADQNEDGIVDVKHLEPDTLKILQVIFDSFVTSWFLFCKARIFSAFSEDSVNLTSVTTADFYRFCSFR